MLGKQRSFHNFTIEFAAAIFLWKKKHPFDKKQANLYVFPTLNWYNIHVVLKNQRKPNENLHKLKCILNCLWQMVTYKCHLKLWTACFSFSFEVNSFSGPGFSVAAAVAGICFAFFSIHWSLDYLKSVQIHSYFWSAFSCIRTKYRNLLRKSRYSVRIQEHTDQK